MPAPCILDKKRMLLLSSEYYTVEGRIAKAASRLIAIVAVQTLACPTLVTPTQKVVQL
jgi:hypothetical protein